MHWVARHQMLALFATSDGGGHPPCAVGGIPISGLFWMESVPAGGESGRM
ncbi:hypothetical protein ABT255_58235 [Streptomyces mirabilis]